jgi:hypothetical protein
MADVGWLAEQARHIHQIFTSMFYIFLTTLLLLGIFIEYFKWPLGEMPGFAHFIGRALIAVILLHTYPDVSNLIADIVDGLSQKLGDLNQFNLVLAQMGEKLDHLTWSWVSVKDIVIWLLSFVTFFLLYISVHAVNAFSLFTWTVLYVLAPFLIVLYVLPSTSHITKALYKSLIEVGSWKVIWAVLATLLWSFALSKINHPQEKINFITVIFLNLILAGSVLLTPLVVHAIAGGGFAGLAAQSGGLVAGATMTAPMQFAKSAYNKTKPVRQGVGASYSALTGLAASKKAPSTPKTRSLNPPKWHKEVPFPTEPPEFLKSKLEREKSKN